MNTYNGYLEVRVEGDRIYITVDDHDVGTRSTAELSRANTQSLRATLDEALIRIDYPEIYRGRENDNLEQP